jgi:hypothetical protein
MPPLLAVLAGLRPLLVRIAPHPVLAAPDGPLPLLLFLQVATAACSRAWTEVAYSFKVTAPPCLSCATRGGPPAWGGPLSGPPMSQLQ